MPPAPSVQRYAHPTTHGWTGYMEPADAEEDWVLFADFHGRCRLFIACDGNTGAVIPPTPPANEVLQ